MQVTFTLRIRNSRSAARRCYNMLIYMSRKSSTTRQVRAKRREVKEYDALIRYASTIVLIASGVVFLLAMFDAAGPVGTTLFVTSYAIVGIGAFLLPFALIAVGFYAGNDFINQGLVRLDNFGARGHITVDFEPSPEFRFFIFLETTNF